MNNIINVNEIPFYEFDQKSLELFDKGLESFVYKAYSNRLKKNLVIKKPKENYIFNDNDQGFYAKDQYNMELKLLNHLKNNDFEKIPKAYQVINIDDSPLFIQEFVSGHTKPFTEEEVYKLGNHLSRLHRIIPPEFPINMSGEENIYVTIGERITRRLNVINKCSSKSFQLPQQDVLVNLLNEGPNNNNSILHMDLRPQNILRNKNNIVSFIDWSNALIGDPLLEIARANEYGIPLKYLLHGYENDIFFSKIKESIYRLDAAIMLGVVFLSEAPDAKKAKIQLARIEELSNVLNMDI